MCLLRPSGQISTSLLRQLPSLSQAVFSTYHRGRPAREDTGTHNPLSAIICHFYTWTFYTLLCRPHCFPLAESLSVRAEPTGGIFLQQAFPIATKGFWGFYGTTREKPIFKLQGMFGLCANAAQCDTLKEVEKIKRSILASCKTIVWSKPKIFANGSEEKMNKGSLRTVKGWLRNNLFS